jgi:hypothetical protein
MRETILEHTPARWRERAESLQPRSRARHLQGHSDCCERAVARDLEETLMKTAEPPKEGEMNPGDQAPPGTPGTGESLCPECSGKGSIEGKRCEACGGSGKVIEGVGGA